MLAESGTAPLDGGVEGDGDEGAGDEVTGQTFDDSPCSVVPLVVVRAVSKDDA